MTPEQQKAIALANARMRKAKAEEKPVGVTAAGVYDAAKTIGANAGVEVLAGVGGLGKTLMSGPQAGGQYVDQFRDYYSVEPSPEGAAVLQPVMETMQPVSQAFGALSEDMGKSGATIARAIGGGDRAQAAGYAMGKILPDAALAFAGGSGMARRALASNPVEDMAMRAGAEARAGEEAMRIRMGADDADLATKKIDPNLPSATVRDPVAENVLKQGFKPGIVQMIKISSPADKAAMREMIDIWERGQKSANYSALNRPADAAGASIMKRIDLLKGVKQQAGKDLEIAAESLKGQTVDYTGAVDGFVDALDKMGVKITENGVAVTKGSDIEGLIGIEGYLNRVVRRMYDTKTPDAYDVHRLKKYIDENVGYGAKSAEGLTGKTEKALKDLRRNLNEALKSFPEYADANMRYADTKGVLDEFQEMAGKGADLSSDPGNRAMGRTVRKIFSNYQSRDRLIAALDDANRVSQKYGGKFDDDIINQALFVQELERRFGTSATSSLQGEFVKAGEAVLRKGPMRAAMDYAAEKGIDYAVKKRGVTDENALRAIKELLKDQ